MERVPAAASAVWGPAVSQGGRGWCELLSSAQFTLPGGDSCNIVRSVGTSVQSEGEELGDMEAVRVREGWSGVGALNAERGQPVRDGWVREWVEVGGSGWSSLCCENCTLN